MNTISVWGLSLIKSYTPCLLSATKNSLGFFEIGYHHPSASFQTITENQADTFLVEDCQPYADCVDKSEKKFTKNQRDALIAFGLDCRMNALKRVLQNDDLGQMKLMMLSYIHPLDGTSKDELKKKREAEVRLFDTP